MTEQHNKILKKKQQEIETLAEANRRQAVSQEKLFGYVIEKIEYERDKLKKRKYLGKMMGIYGRTQDLRKRISFYLISQNFSNVPIEKIIEIYRNIRGELAEICDNLGDSIKDLPDINEDDLDLFGNSQAQLNELNILTGQLEAIAFSKLIDIL